MAEDRQEDGARRRPKKDPEFTDVTCIVAIIGEKREESGQKIVHLPGEDVRMKTQLARRLANANRPRVAIGKEDRDAARKNAKRVAAVIAKREARRGTPPSGAASASE